jgi:aminoglycoside phosphotransferase (APT) family kinase protein
VVTDAGALESAELGDSVGVPDPAQAASICIAIPGLAGTTRRVPIATVPVATTPTTDAADRPRRACFGTVITPSHRCLPCISDHAPRRTHRPTVTNHPESGHPRIRTDPPILLLASRQQPHYVAKKLRREGEQSVAGGTADSGSAEGGEGGEPAGRIWSDSVRGLDLTRLTRYLGVRLPGSVRPPLRALPLPGGRSNLTYELCDADGKVFVLRRPPLPVGAGNQVPIPATLAPPAPGVGRGDVRREYQVIRALFQAHGRAGRVPVAEPFLLCQDTSVIGAPFFVTAKVAGTVFRSEKQAAALSPAQARTLSHGLVDTLAALHLLDVRATGLADFSRTDQFLMRQVDRWDRLHAASASREVPKLARLAAGLRAGVPGGDRVAVLHGDFRLENVVVSATSPGRIAAVLDWEAAALGDPLVDLGLLLTFWEGTGTAAKPIASAHTNSRGFPSIRQMAERYALKTGFDLSRVGWYIALNHYRVAGLLEALHYRTLHGLPVAPGLEHAGKWVPDLVESGLAALRDEI